MDVRLTAEDGYQAQRSYSIASAPEDEHLVLTVERLQSITIGFVTALVIAGLVVVAFLERPYGEGAAASGRPRCARRSS